jgi:hypothetical protein
VLYASLEEGERCFDWLDKAYQIHDPFLLFLHLWSAYTPFFHNPRFQRLLVKLGLISV